MEPNYGVLMLIVDINGKEKEALLVKIIPHQVRDALSDQMVNKMYVEALIKGKHRNKTWKEWYPLEEFQKRNPNIEL